MNQAIHISIGFKDDFQSILSTLESLFVFLYFDSCKTSQNVTFHSCLSFVKEIQSFMSTAVMDAKLYVLFFSKSLDETTL